MPFVTYMGVAAALVVTGFVLTFSQIPIDQAPPELPPIPVATLEAIGSTTPFNVQVEALIPSPHFTEILDAALSGTSTPTTTPAITPIELPKTPEPAKLPAPAPLPVVPTPTPLPAPLPTPAPIAPILPPVSAPLPDPEPEELSGTERLKAASVNILCTTTGSPVRGASGSGVIIDSRGIIMTVAHIAQYHLLYNYPNAGSTSCVIRTGSPAKRAYYAKLIYISDAWLRENPRTLVSAAPTGSGKNDIAFLAITGSVSGSPLPKSFTFVPLSDTDPKKGDTVTVAAYPAQTLTGSQIHSDLSMTVVQSTIKDRYTFESTSTDIIALSGSEAAQTGSSGGGVMGKNGEIVGLITTSSNTGPYVSRTMQAITPNYIRRSFKADTGRSLDTYLSGSIQTLTGNLERVLPLLSEILIKGIE